MSELDNILDELTDRIYVVIHRRWFQKQFLWKTISISERMTKSEAYAIANSIKRSYYYDEIYQVFEYNKNPYKLNDQSI